MNSRFTTDNAAMLLIDHQVRTINLAKNISHAEIIRNMRALARVAMATGMPIVLTSSLETEFQGLLLDDLKTIAPEAYGKRVKILGIVDAWEGRCCISNRFHTRVSGVEKVKFKDFSSFQALKPLLSLDLLMQQRRSRDNLRGQTNFTVAQITQHGRVY